MSYNEHTYMYITFCNFPYKETKMYINKVLW